MQAFNVAAQGIEASHQYRQKVMHGREPMLTYSGPKVRALRLRLTSKQVSHNHRCTRSVWSGLAASPATARSYRWNWTACTSYRSWYPAASPISPTTVCTTFSDHQQPLGICGGLTGGPRDSPRLHAEGQVPDLLEHPRPLLRQEALRKFLPLAVGREDVMK